MQSESHLKTGQEPPFFSPSLHIALLIFLFVLALGARLYRLADPPFDFHPMRQYHSFLVVRGDYFASLDTIPEWRKEIAALNKQGEVFVEARITETLTLWGYRLLGGEYIWLPRLLTSLFWLVGGVFLYLLARELISPDAALFSVAFYLFLPFGVSASRSFQPDPLMIMLFLAGLYAIYRYHRRPSLVLLIIAGVVCGLSILVKMIGLFALFATFFALHLYRYGLKKTVVSGHLIGFVAISVLPFTMYFLYGYFFSGLLQGQVQGRILPQLWLSRLYWGGWLNQIEKVVGYIALILGLLGVFFIQDRPARALLLGLWAGYIAFGLVFTYHIYTHDYYQLQLIPILALSIGPIFALILSHLEKTYRQGTWRLAILAILLFGLSLSLYKTRWRVINTGYEREVKVAQEIGQAVNHSTKTIFLAPNYGRPLVYHGELYGLNWPQAGDFYLGQLSGQPIPDTQELFNEWISTYAAEYFIVTDFEEFAAQSELKNLLTHNYPVIANTPDYLIFKLD
jgi:hypothetical protein